MLLAFLPYIFFLLLCFLLLAFVYIAFYARKQNCISQMSTTVPFQASVPIGAIFSATLWNHTCPLSGKFWRGSLSVFLRSSFYFYNHFFNVFIRHYLFLFHFLSSISDAFLLYCLASFVHSLFMCYVFSLSFVNLCIFLLTFYISFFCSYVLLLCVSFKTFYFFRFLPHNIYIYIIIYQLFSHYLISRIFWGLL